jgi:hypothetical protein
MIMNNEFREKTYFKMLFWNFVGGVTKAMGTLLRLVVSG